MVIDILAVRRALDCRRVRSVQCRLGVTVYTDLRVATRLTVRTAIGYTAITVIRIRYVHIHVCECVAKPKALQNSSILRAGLCGREAKGVPLGDLGDPRARACMLHRVSDCRKGEIVDLGARAHL